MPRHGGSTIARVLLAGLFVLATAGTAFAVDPAVLKAQQRRIAVVARVAPTVVAIFARGGRGGGSGVLIGADGYALTNYHVTRGAGTFMKCGLSDGRLYDAVVVGIDPTGDVALVKLLGRDDFPRALLGDSDKLAVGDWTFAMGNPFLLATDFQPTVTYGIVSGVHRYQYPAGTFLEYTDCIQIDTSINPGNSGGPLFNDAGELVGINGRGSFEKRGRVNSGAGYAISINQIKYFMDHLRSGRIVDHGTLGATVATRDDGSVVVNGILEESEAYRRGLRSDDEIVSFAGRSIRSVNQFKNILGIYPKGWKLPLVFRRDQQRQEIMLRLRGLHRASELSGQPRRRPPRPKRPGQPDSKKKKRPSRRPQAAPPAKYKHLYIKKPGYANYYFNQVEQKRTLAGLASLGDFSDRTGRWELVGKTAAGDAWSLTLADDGAGMNWKGKPYYQALEDGDPADEPPGTGGLLVALHQLKLFLVQRDKGFGKFYYLGSEPLDGRGQRVDVIATELGNVESRWYVSRQSGTLVGFDTRIEEDVDSCDIRFAGVKSIDGRTLPAALVVRSADRAVAEFRLEQVTLGTKPATGEKKKP